MKPENTKEAMKVTSENGTVFTIEIAIVNSAKIIVISWDKYSRVITDSLHLIKEGGYVQISGYAQIDGDTSSPVDRFKVYVAREYDLQCLTPTNVKDIVKFAHLTALLEKHNDHVNCLVENVNCPLYGLIMKDMNIDSDYIKRAKTNRQRVADELEELTQGPECEICGEKMPHPANDYEMPLCSQECRDQDRQNGICNWDLDKCKDLLNRI